MLVKLEITVKSLEVELWKLQHPTLKVVQLHLSQSQVPVPATVMLTTSVTMTGQHTYRGTSIPKQFTRDEGSLILLPFDAKAVE